MPTDLELDPTGSAPDVKAPGLKVKGEKRFAIQDAKQAIATCEQLLADNKPRVTKLRAMTAQLNGQPPRRQRELIEQGRNWYPNFSRMFMRKEASVVPSRLAQPILTAKFLTAAELPAGWPNGAVKSAIFRTKVSAAIRSWPAWRWFIKQLAREVGFFGFGFNCYFDRYSWEPTFIRQDRGFVPSGSEIGREVPLLMVLWDYRPDELLEAVEKAGKSGLGTWDKKNVAAAINAAKPKKADATEINSRSYEEMVRQSTIGTTYEKGYRVVQAWILFSVDHDGSVSQHVLSADGTKNSDSSAVDTRQLFVQRDAFPKMRDCMGPVVFDPDDGTIQGSWGAVQYMFRMALEAEKSNCDMVAWARMSAKVMTQCAEGKSADEAKLKVLDHQTILEGATFAGNQAAVSSDPKHFLALKDAFETDARELIGNNIPPIPLQPSDIKSAHIKAKLSEQDERKEQQLDQWLWQIDMAVTSPSIRRLVNDKSPDKRSKKLLTELRKDLTNEEIELLTNPETEESIFDFTEYAASQRAAFCQSMLGDPFFNQKALRQTMAEVAGGRAFAESHLLPGDDQTVQKIAAREQDMETAAMETGKVIEVLPMDSDWFHMQALKPDIVRNAEGGNVPLLKILLPHYASHYAGAVAKKAMPKDQINAEKSFIAKIDEFVRMGVVPPEGFGDQPTPLGETVANPPMPGGPALMPTPQLGDGSQALSALVSGAAAS